MNKKIKADDVYCLTKEGAQLLSKLRGNTMLKVKGTFSREHVEINGKWYSFEGTWTGNVYDDDLIDFDYDITESSEEDENGDWITSDIDDDIIKKEIENEIHRLAERGDYDYLD